MDALVVAGTPARRNALTEVLYREKINCVVCSTAAEARRASLSRPFDIFIIYAGLPDEHGNELAVNISSENECGGVYIDDITRSERLESDLNDCGVVVLKRPVTKSELVDRKSVV